MLCEFIFGKRCVWIDSKLCTDDLMQKKKLCGTVFHQHHTIIHVYEIGFFIRSNSFFTLPIKINIKYLNNFAFGRHIHFHFPFLFRLCLFFGAWIRIWIFVNLFLYTYATLPQFKTQFTKLVISSTNPTKCARVCVCVHVFIGVCWIFFERRMWKEI